MFQKSIIEKYLSKIDANLLHEKYELFCANYKNETKIANIRTIKEEQYQEGFIRDVFCSVLNYTIKPEPDYNILTELKNETKNKNNARKSDGAICEENNENSVRAVIELKGTDTTDLDTVARQAFDYKSHHENCNYVIVCNFERLRVYVETQIEFIEFNLFTLNYEDFCILYLLMELTQLKNDVPLKIKHETLSEEKQITDNFYADYSTFKRLLFEDMIENNPEIDKLVLFKKTQKLLDRILFILFCEDRGLLPANSVMGIIGDYQKLKEMGYAQPLYSVFKTYFDRIDKGYKSESDSTKNIFAYNGGLFKQDEILDSLKIGDDVLFIHTKRLADYDFESQISVDILGRIFENSLTEIEEIQKEIEAEKSGEKVENNNVGKRKKDGVFYTPEYITKYIVENTIGKLCEQKRAELNINDEAISKALTKKEKDRLNKALNEYQEWLFTLKILDPACGSGAFLTAALTQLKTEHRRVFDFLRTINNDTMAFAEYSDNSILENNLYGVDINEESVEITKLSLWLHTAQKDRKLTTLNNKIKCGNSLIDDPAVAGEKAFVWEKEFPEVFEKGGFDVVIGNPPYVRAELLLSKDITFYKNNFNVFNPDGDLFSYFYEKGLSLLNENGIFGFISNTFDKTTSGKTLRDFIATKTTIEKYVDFTEVQIFSGATTYPIILILKKKFEEGNIFIYKKIPNSMNGNIVINACNDVNVSQANLNSESWSFESNELKSILNKITSFPTVSEKYGKCYRGVLTGLNEAFFIDEATKNRLIEEDPKSAELIKKVFEGKDLNKWINRPIEKYILSVHNGYDDIDVINIDDYKAVKNYLNGFYDKLEKRYDKGKTPYNLRNCAYQSLFEKNKVIWGNLQNSNKFSYDETKTIVSAPCCMLPTDNKSLVSILNSKIVWKFLTSICVVRNGGYIEVKPQYFEQIPIPDFENNKELDDLTDKMLALNENLQKKSGNFLKVVKQTFALEKISTKLETFYDLDFDGFMKELKQKVTPKTKLEWLEIFEDTKNQLQELQTQITATDKEINALVYKLYDLTAEEIAIVEGR
ncbi:Eco57I restriction-modification methylase domain-containing protein [Treponema sp.]|uniref:Eco57I restriction-modification methylase domain-containing protein n=1 Tax=Treponema sp. TaxID=166 RepID=UPI003F11D740